MRAVCLRHLILHACARSSARWALRVGCPPIVPTPPLSRATSRGISACASASTQRVLDPVTANASTSAILQAVENEIGALSTTAVVPSLQPVVIIISGPSGVGKDAVVRALQTTRPDLHFVVTATSRPKRPGEVDGIDYYFVTRQAFEDWIAAGQLLEHAVVYGDYKGIPKLQVMAALGQGTDVILRLDIQGAATVRQLMPQAISIFLVADSEAELVTRLVERKTEPLESMVLRVKTARKEMQSLAHFDYVVVNRDGDLATAVRQIEAIITAEKLRVDRLVAECSPQNAGGSGL